MLQLQVTVRLRLGYSYLHLRSIEASRKRLDGTLRYTRKTALEGRLSAPKHGCLGLAAPQGPIFGLPKTRWAGGAPVAGHGDGY